MGQQWKSLVSIRYIIIDGDLIFESNDVEFPLNECKKLLKCCTAGGSCKNS